MPEAMTAKAALDRYFLETRCKLIEIAANLDRIERGAGSSDVRHDPRMTRVREALQVLTGDAREADRAERMQTIFSQPFSETWQPPNRRA